MPSEFQVITSAQNPRVKNLVRLREARHRRRSGYFLIEGEREVERALVARWTLTSLFFAPELFRAPATMDLVESAAERDVETIQLAPEAFAKAAYREGPDGILALAPARSHALEDLAPRSPALLLVVAGVEKPGNLGALMRTANAAGADALIACDPVCDLYNPHAIRASQGAFFDLPLAAAEGEGVRRWLGERGITAVTTSPGAPQTLWETDLTRPLALVVGAENTGLDKAWLENASEPVGLPMAGLTDSLNVSVAAGIALFEAVRQRTPRG
ncbi:MAG: TrmH family RNA methyltransferase [Opitutales bacterium]